MDEADKSKKAGMIIDNGTAMGVPRVIEPSHIVNGNTKVNTLYCSYIFNTKHGLKPLEGEVDPATFEDDDIEGTIEERQFRLWINSLGIEGVDVTDLYDDVRSGILLCKVCDKIQPLSIGKQPEIHQKICLTRLITMENSFEVQEITQPD